MMRHRSRYRGAVALTAAVALFVACQDLSVSPSTSPKGAVTAGAPSTPGDTGTTSSPTPPATSITLAVTVGTPAPGADTLQYTPLANARVSVLRETFTRTTGSGSDTLTTTTTEVASGTTDANGVATFQNLPADAYRLDAVSAGGGEGASTWIAPPYAANVATRIVLRARP